MLAIDQTITFKAIEHRISQTTNSRHLIMLERLLEHAKGEAAPDIERVMATLCSDPIYNAWSSPPEMSPRGRDGVRSFYMREIVDAGRFFFEMHIDRMVVDDGAIATEGYMRMLFTGEDVSRLGLIVDDLNAFYVVKTRLMIVWPYDADGLIIGEDSYSAPIRDQFLTKVNDDQVPEAFKSFLEKRAERRAAS